MNHFEFVEYKDIEVEVWGDYLPLIPEVINLDPEFCHPAEGGYIEDIKFYIDDVYINNIIDENVANTLHARAYNQWMEHGI